MAAAARLELRIDPEQKRLIDESDAVDALVEGVRLLTFDGGLVAYEALGLRVIR